MKSKIIIVFLFIVLNILFSGTALAKTVTVDDSGGCDYTSIQDAIDSNIHYDPEFDKYYPDADVTIIVYPGVYQESVKLSFPLSLKASSSNPEDTVIESEGYAIELSNTATWYTNNGGYLISGFTIRGDDSGISEKFDNYNNNNFHLIIENNVITDGNYGLRLYEDQVTMKNNTLKNNSYGLYAYTCGPVNVIGNEFIDNNVGVWTKDSAVYIENNLFTQNGRAIDSNFGDGIHIIGNTIRDNTAGIGVDGANSLIASNVITGNIEYGISSGLLNPQIYNNYFNNEINITPSHRSFELSIDACEGPNIVGGPYIGGNFWGKPDGTGFSQTCPDVDLDGFCDEPYMIGNYSGEYAHLNSFDYLPLKEKVSPPKPILPVANFNSNVTEGYVPLDVQFIDLSENTAGWNWDFGDGAISIQQNPTYTYLFAGNYTVNLTASNTNGTDSKSVTISVSAKPLIVFPGYSNAPSDLDQDGFYEDVNGNGILDFDDVVAYYDNMDWMEENVQLELFDYNNNGLIDFDDVVKLYDMI